MIDRRYALREDPLLPSPLRRANRAAPLEVDRRDRLAVVSRYVCWSMAMWRAGKAGKGHRLPPAPTGEQARQSIRLPRGWPSAFSYPQMIAFLKEMTREDESLSPVLAADADLLPVVWGKKVRANSSKRNGKPATGNGAEDVPAPARSA